MANYCEYSVIDVTDTEDVGVGLGDMPDGTPRLCVALAGATINPTLHESVRAANWIALTPECAAELYALLSQCAHLWDVPRRRPRCHE